MEKLLLEMTVKNHPGVMSHIAGLFSRRAVNIEEIAVMKADGATSRMLLLVVSGDRTMTVIRQLADHYDVVDAHWKVYDRESIFEEDGAAIRRQS
jgi:acetolactate synthase-1/3 small subunit